MLQDKESLARHIAREHRGRQPDDVEGRQLTPVPRAATGDATVDRVVSDNWHAIVSRHRIRPGNYQRQVLEWRVAAIPTGSEWQQCLADFEDSVEAGALQMQGDGERWFSSRAQNERGVALLPLLIKQCPTICG